MIIVYVKLLQQIKYFSDKKSEQSFQLYEQMKYENMIEL